MKYIIINNKYHLFFKVNNIKINFVMIQNRLVILIIDIRFVTFSKLIIDNNSLNLIIEILNYSIIHHDMLYEIKINSDINYH